ncbi:AMP-binding protein [Wohlfahrtiimonas chitiniclastica]|uniref:AMP-binding protein n=1 Tax=Wohlfahrtiimonas chitiniclastica TaxID=400946 RepID=UPI001BCFC88C|nr:AMP-binding protein [Wohlfahrtiimonas chitiniclastica]MBS7838161.1 acyl-CoA synthetase [Wohlfahrtiimonas chitiniclastica]
MRYQDLFLQHNPAAIRYIDGQRALSFSDLKARIATLAHRLHNMSEQRFVIASLNCFEVTACFFALLYAGKTPVILGHTREKLLAEQREHYDAILTDRAMSLEAPCQMLDEITTQHLPLDFSAPIEDQVVHFFTSGSSGIAKCIPKRMALLAKESALLQQTWPLMQGTVVIATVSPLHQYGLTFNILWPLINEGCVYMHAITYQEELAGLPPNRRYAFITSPAFLKRLDPALMSPLEMTHIFSAGGPLPSVAAHECEMRLQCAPIEIYGSSETCVIAHRMPTKHALFQPFKGIEIMQNNDQTLRLSSPLIDAADFSLNDRIAIHVEGFELLGRTDRILKMEEKRISLTEIEARIEAYLPNCTAHLVPLIHGQRTILGAVLVMAQPHDPQHLIRDLTTHLKAYIEPIALPKRWRLIDKAPVNAQGKVSHYDLKELFDD